MEYFGRASVVVDLCFTVKADSLEEAQEKVIGAECLEFELKDIQGNKILEDYDMDEWYVVDEAQRGNIRQSGIHDFEIWEED